MESVYNSFKQHIYIRNQCKYAYRSFQLLEKFLQRLIKKYSIDNSNTHEYNVKSKKSNEAKSPEYFNDPYKIDFRFCAPLKDNNYRKKQ